ncbi:uncharacterized protein LOC129339545 [Eublepharis macularius]|uniref:Uncharacterized protein LOC129339545 n=1 Tax=Eublepharis macularius TaxID=481883 RepID=A0AA97K578_EUBMA|nr:uncharacterized protein LOC129339545 [Eublepharis macularius]
MVGYSVKRKGYRITHLCTNKISISRAVYFESEELPPAEGDCTEVNSQIMYLDVNSLREETSDPEIILIDRTATAASPEMPDQEGDTVEGSDVITQAGSAYAKKEARGSIRARFGPNSCLIGPESAQIRMESAWNGLQQPIPGRFGLTQAWIGPMDACHATWECALKRPMPSLLARAEIDDQREVYLLETLEQLDARHLRVFLHYLRQIEPKGDRFYFYTVSDDPKKLTDLLLDHYGVDYGTEVTVKVLKSMYQEALAKKLADFQHNAQHFVERNKKELIRRVYMVQQVLEVLKVSKVIDPYQYGRIMAEGTDRQKMKELYKLVLKWNNKNKDCLYQALRETNPFLLKEMEGGHFVERYQKELIEKVSGVDIILFRLLGYNLKPYEYHCFITKETDALKMKKLYELVPSWNTEEKNRLYRELIQTHGTLIAALEGGSEAEDIMASLRNEEHFIEKHQEELIRRIIGVEVVLHSALCDSLITREQMKEIKGSPQQQMQKLYELVPSWNTEDKEKLQYILMETNQWLIAQLAGGHFVDRHQEELIERVTEVPLNQLRGFALDEEQYETLLHCATAKMQMLALFQMEQKWNRQQKDRLYRALAETNPDVIKILEEEHFIEKHREELIHRASRVDAILRRLQDQQSLMKEGSDQQKMEQLYTQVPKWNRKQKDYLYMVLKTTNGPLVAEMEEGHFVERHKKELIENVTKVQRVAQLLLRYINCRQLYVNIVKKDTDKERMEILCNVVPSWNGVWKNRLYQELRATNEPLIKELEGRRSSKEGLVPDPLAEEKCYLCPKEKGFPVVQPEFIPDAEGKLKTYRIRLPGAGIFFCSVTELKFEVRAAVTVKYTYGSWDEHLSEAEMQTWVVAGPLFDIHADPAGEVAAVHLPHFICLQEGKTDISQMKIAHIVEAGMALEAPSRVTQFHAVLENPQFSLLGVLLKPLQRFIPIHSVVLLYQTCRRTVTLHLYLVPNDSSLTKAIEDREKSRRSVLVDKHPQTDEPLYYGSRYIVFSSAELRINPLELEFSYKNPGQLQSFVDIYLGKIERINLSLKKKEGLFSIWDAWLESEDILVQEEHQVSNREIREEERADLHLSLQTLSIRSDTNSQTESIPVSSIAEGRQAAFTPEPHFIEQHRQQLIQRTATVEGVLDLLYGVVLDEEQYERISSRGSNKEKMRELYRLVPSWNLSCKDQLYEALKKNNPFLIADLEGR